MLLPFVLGSSPHLPVSVCGTGIYILDSHAFLASVILDNSLLLFFTIPCGTSFSSSSLIFLYCVTCAFYCISIVQEFFACYPSATPFGLTLGPDLPWADEPSPGNLRLSTARILTLLSLLIPAFSLLSRPAVLSVYLRPTIECSSTTYVFLHKFAISVNSLAPVIFRATSLDQ